MCGIVGLIGTPDAAKEAFLGLTTLQHRGQDAAGILSYDSHEFHRVKDIGLVESIFTRSNMGSLTGTIALGHVRYSTSGKGDLIEVQPFLLNYPFGLGMVHNGNLTNGENLKKELRIQNRRHLLTHSDTEIILNLFAEGLAQTSMEEGNSSELNFEHICNAVQNVYLRTTGSYSISTIIADRGLVAFRDPYGIRPLIWGRRQNKQGSFAHMVASESVALSFLGYEVIRDLQPGEVLFIDHGGKVFHRVLNQRGRRACMFEWVYFASPESEIDQIPVYRSRINLGKNLGQKLKEQINEGKIQPDVIVPVPETSRIAAIALAEFLGIPYREVLIKNRYIKRTFILDSQEKREKAVHLKLSPVRSEIVGKRILLVDDSIVRGTTSKKIIEIVRRAGASKVYFVSTCPPVKHPCYYGIDFPEESELIASGRSIESIQKELGVDALIYQDIESLKKSILEASIQDPLSEKINPCLACLNRQYPTMGEHVDCVSKKIEIDQEKS